MTNERKTRLLFVISQDFGELNIAASIAQEPAFESLLLLPRPLYAVHHAGLPVAGEPYPSPAEVLAAVERFRPDIVFLCSGYLFANNYIFSNQDLAHLVRHMRARGGRIATTDPFIGLTAAIDENPFNQDYIHYIRPPLFAEAHAILKDCPHLYTADPGDCATTEVLTYSHRSVVKPPEQRRCPTGIQQMVGLDPTRPHWVFVLGKFDYELLTEAGPEAFEELLTDQLYEVLDQGKQPVLIAPQACTSGVTLRTTLASGIVLLPFCRLDWFLPLLLDAEYAFYWNIFSNSILARVMNRLPIFFFDHGHLALANASLYDRVRRSFYVGGLPSCVDFSQPLDAGELARHAEAQLPVMNAFREQVLRPPPPEEMVRQFMQRPL